MWEVLLAATELKSIHMSQAWQLEKFNHGIDNMTAWLAEVEATLSSPDFGSDLASVELLTKEHALLERDIKTHKDIIDIIVTAAQQFSECGHFDLKNILSKKVSSVLPIACKLTPD
jgi:spectrin alpha